jgi:hypothetical protein
VLEFAGNAEMPHWRGDQDLVGMVQRCGHGFAISVGRAAARCFCTIATRGQAGVLAGIAVAQTALAPSRRGRRYSKPSA